MPYLNRTLCDVLEEMRGCVKTLNFSYLLGLIEEAQSMGNRMEAKIEDFSDYEGLRDSISELENRRNELLSEIRRLELKRD